MNIRICLILMSIALGFSLQSCLDANSENIPSPKDKSDLVLAKKFSEYWYQGKAEVTRFALSQNRYKDTHPGEVVLIQVTEDFLVDQQVKNDNYQNPNSVPALKTNLISRFTTGIYDYQMMTSVFNPTDLSTYPNAQKVSFSSQDWCGQSFMQLNKNKKGYMLQLRSYFESEGDKEVQITTDLLEDELFNHIRFNPENLQTGNINILPSSTILRLLHKKAETVSASASLEAYNGSDFTGSNLMAYTLKMPSLNRTLAIVFENEFPFQIAGWSDSYPSVFDKKIRTTLAKKTNQVMTDYWAQNSADAVDNRKNLGLSTFE